MLSAPKQQQTSQANNMKHELPIIEIARDWLRMLPDMVDAVQLVAGSIFLLATAVALAGVAMIVRAWRRNDG